MRTNRSVLAFGGSTLAWDRGCGDAEGVFAREYRRANVRPLLDERGETLRNVKRFGTVDLRRFWGMAPERGLRARRVSKPVDAAPVTVRGFEPMKGETVLEAAERETRRFEGGLPWERKADAYRVALDKALADGRIDEATWERKVAQYCA